MRTICHQMQQMPAVLRSLTQMCFGFALFAVFAFGNTGNIDGEPLAREEFWRRGAGPLFLLIGVIFPIIGYGFTRRAGWSRPMFVAVALVLSGIPFISSMVSPHAILTTAPLLIPATYLYSSSKVSAYFSEAPQKKH